MLPYEHGGDIFAHDNIQMDYSANLNPLGMPPAVKTALLANIDNFAHYPDPHCRQLTKALAAYESWPEDGILFGNGAADLIFRLCLSIKPAKALVCAPTFSGYEKGVIQSGGKIFYHFLKEANGFQLDYDFLEELTPDLELVFLCNPNNPTGRLINSDLLKAIIAKCKEINCPIVVDECFLDFTKGLSVKPLLAENHYLFILKAFTKTYALAGLRLGYLLSANKESLQNIKVLGQSWSVSTPAQVAGLAALTAENWLADSRLLIETERPFLSSQLKSLGLDVLPSDVNYLLFYGNSSLHDKMLKQGFLIRRCDNFPGLKTGYYRVCVKTNEENQRFLAAMKGAMENQ